MRTRPLSFMLAGALLAWGHRESPAAPQEQDLLPAVKKATADLAAAEKSVTAARGRLQSAREKLEPQRFNSAAYNAKVTADQVKAAQEKHEKAGPAEKEDALEALELAQDLAEKRKTELAAAELALPQREREAGEAEEKRGAALAAAEKLADPVKALVRQAEGEAQAKLRSYKHAAEKAAIVKAAAEQQSAANARLLKTLAEAAAADKGLRLAAAAVKQASEQDRPQKSREAEPAVKAYALAVQAAALKTDPGRAAAVEALAEADKAVQKAAAALKQARQEQQDRTGALKKAEDRVKAAQEALEKGTAKIRAQKDLAREQEAAKRAQASKLDAERALTAKTEEAEKSQVGYAAALREAVAALVERPDPGTPADGEAAIAGREAEIKKENEALARGAAQAQEEAAKARADLSAADKSLSDRTAAREALERTMRQRFYREVDAAHNESVRLEKEIADAGKSLQAATAPFEKASAALTRAKEAAAKARAQAALAEGAAREKEAAEKAAQEKVAARSAAGKNVEEARAALDAARAELNASPEPDRAAAQKKVAEKEAAAKAAVQKAEEAQAAADASKAALDKVAASLSAAGKRAPEAVQAAKDAEQKATAAQEALDKAAAARNAAEQELGRRRQALGAVLGRLSVAKAAAYGGLKPLPESSWDPAKARHLQVRAGFGGTPDEAARLHALGLQRAVSHFVHFKNQPAADIAVSVRPKERPESYESVLSGDERNRLQQARVAKDRQQIQDMRAGWLRQMVESPRPLEEKLTLFWHGQIPTQYSDVGDSYFMHLENQLFRQNAAGNFSALLYGVAHDPAMLKYLNNDTNVKGRANENLAREIMELFSMGRDQGYSEVDIKEGARALTGYTYDAWSGQFRFIADRHDTEPKTIFGKSGAWSGDDFVQLILETPHPARFIARQIFTFFAHAEPSIDTVEALAGVLRVNNFELTPMLENLFLSEEFYGARSVGTQVKSPVQLVVGLHRDLGLKNADYPYLVTALRNMGQELFEPPSVFGWQGGRAWVTSSRILDRYNFLAEILEKKARGGQIGVDVVGTLLAGRKFRDHAEVVDCLVKGSWNVPMWAGIRQALIDFLAPLPPPAQWGANPGPVNARLTRLLVMLFCCPEYQFG